MAEDWNVTLNVIATAVSKDSKKLKNKLLPATISLQPASFLLVVSVDMFLSGYIYILHLN